MKELSRKFGVDIHKFKTGYDCASCLLSIVMSFAFFGLWHFEGIKLAGVRRDLAKAEENDLTVDFLLEMLHANGAEDLSEWCRYVLRGNICDEGKAYAAWLLSKCGGKEDLKLIWERYYAESDHDFHTCESAPAMKRRNYLDAIEWLQSRER